MNASLQNSDMHLREEIERLRERLRESEDTLRALRSGEVDAIIVNGPDGSDRLYTLEDSNQAYRIIFEEMQEGAATLSADHCILLCNSRFAEIVRMPIQRVIGASLLDFVDERQQVRVRMVLQRTRPVKAHFELTLRAGDGTLLPVYVAMNALSLDGPETISLVVTDLSEIKAAERALRRSEEQFRTIFENAGVGIAQVGLDGRWLRANQKFCATVGYTEVELVWLGARALIYSEDVTAFVEHLRKLTSGQPAPPVVELRFINKNGVTVWARCTLSLLRGPDTEESGPSVLAVVEDVTERRRVERELERSNEELEQFAYVASHDLQEPLRMISSFTQLLGKRYRGRLDADADEFIGFIVDGSARMQQLIGNLLCLSRLNTCGLPFAPADCERALAQALEDLREAIEESGACVTHGMLPMLMGDEAQLGRLFQNLIGNSIKFRSSAPPRIHIRAEERLGEWFFSVRDNGIGIEPEYAERIFMIFQRLHGRSAYEGTGIGLAICKKIVERHGGRIWVESVLGAGATFYFTIGKDLGGSK